MKTPVSTKPLPIPFLLCIVTMTDRAEMIETHSKEKESISYGQGKERLVDDGKDINLDYEKVLEFEVIGHEDMMGAYVTIYQSDEPHLRSIFHCYFTDLRILPYIDTDGEYVLTPDEDIGDYIEATTIQDIFKTKEVRVKTNKIGYDLKQNCCKHVNILKIVS